MFWDLYQQMQIHDVQDSARRAKDDTATLLREMRELRRTVDSLTLTCAAMWELQREKGGISNAELMEKMQEIDLRDGRLDGKMTKPSAACPSCQRPNNASRQRCMYCGAQLPALPI